MGGLKSMSADANELGNLVLTVAVVIIFLGKMATTASVGTTAQTALSSAVGYVDDFIDWISLIVLFIVIIYLRKKSRGAMSS